MKKNHETPDLSENFLLSVCEYAIYLIYGIPDRVFKMTLLHRLQMNFHGG